MRSVMTLCSIAVLMFGSACSLPGFLDDADDQSFVWRVDGEEFNASNNGMGADRALGNVLLVGASCGTGATLQILIAEAPSRGTLSIGSFNLSWTPDRQSGVAAGTSWEAGRLGGSGTLTITELSSSRIVGNFAVQAVPRVGGSATGNRAIQGTFDLAFNERTVC
jgi:hypothetical protein